MIALAVAAGVVLTVQGDSQATRDPIEKIEVGYSELVQGKPADAIARIGKSHTSRTDDPVVLINLAAANARLGRTEEAKRMLAVAVLSPARFDVQLGDGRWMDSRHAARVALGSLGSIRILATR